MDSGQIFPSSTSFTVFLKFQLVHHELEVEHSGVSDLLWQVDKTSDPQKIRLEAEKREDVVCISALSGEGLPEFCNAVQDKLKVQTWSQSEDNLKYTFLLFDIM